MMMMRPIDGASGCVSAPPPSRLRDARIASHLSAHHSGGLGKLRFVVVGNWHYEMIGEMMRARRRRRRLCAAAAARPHVVHIRLTSPLTCLFSFPSISFFLFLIPFDLMLSQSSLNLISSFWFSHFYFRELWTWVVVFNSTFRRLPLVALFFWLRAVTCLRGDNRLSEL